MFSAMSFGLGAAKAAKGGGQLFWSTELNIRDKKLLSFHQLLSTLGWRSVSQISNHYCHPLLWLLWLVHANTSWNEEFDCNNQPRCETVSTVLSFPLAACPGCCREENLSSFEMTASSLQSVPSSQGGRWIPSLKNSHTLSNCNSGHLAVRLSPSSLMGGQKVMFILLPGTLKPAHFHSLISSASQTNHSFTSPKGTKAVKILSLKSTKDFLFLSISPKSSSALMFLELF